MVYGMRGSSYKWKEHNKKGTFSMKIHERLGNPDFDNKKTLANFAGSSDGDDSFVIISSVVFGMFIFIVIAITLVYYCLLKHKRHVKLDKGGKQHWQNVSSSEKSTPRDS